MNNKRTPRRTKSSRDTLWNVLTVVFLLSTMCSCLYSFSLFNNPYSELNFFPPDPATSTPIPPTWTPIPFDATWTPTPTIQPSPSNTKRPTITLEPTNTPFVILPPTLDVSPTVTVKPTGVPYGNTVTYHDSTTFRPDTDCTKLLIAGRVMNAKNEPVVGSIVKMGGAIGGKSFIPPIQVLSGLKNDYGPSGFEFDLGVEPIASTKTVWVQLFSQSNQALSDQIFVTTYKDCKRNLALITFLEK